MAVTLSPMFSLSSKPSFHSRGQRLPYNNHTRHTLQNPNSVSPSTRTSEPSIPVILSPNSKQGEFHNPNKSNTFFKILGNYTEKVDVTYMGYEAWSPNPPKVQKPLSMHNATSLAFIGDCVYESGMGKNESEIIRNAEKLVEFAMSGNDASHDFAHAFRVRDLAVSLAFEEGLSSSDESMEVVELAALFHDIGDYKYTKDSSEEKIVEDFLVGEGVEEIKRARILDIIFKMGFKEELGSSAESDFSLEFGVVQDADRLDAIGAIGIARCFTFGGSRNHILHDPKIKPRSELSKEQYMKKEEQTMMNHFHEKLLKLKDLMKTKAGKKRAEKRHKFMEEFVQEFYDEWDAKA